MQISERGLAADNRFDAGVTLIELLVVVAVLSVLSIGVTFTLGGQTTDDASDDASRFLEIWQRQADFARQSRVPHGLVMDTGAVQPVRLGPDGWRENGARVAWTAQVAVDGVQRGQGLNVPDLIALPSGQSTAFSVSFSNGLTGGRVECTGGGWDAVTCR